MHWRLACHGADKFRCARFITAPVLLHSPCHCGECTFNNLQPRKTMELSGYANQRPLSEHGSKPIEERVDPRSVKAARVFDISSGAARTCVCGRAVAANAMAWEYLQQVCERLVAFKRWCPAMPVLAQPCWRQEESRGSAASASPGLRRNRGS
jgi:hypothetical protein